MPKYILVHGCQVVDMTTSEPSLAREIFAVAQEKCVRSMPEDILAL